MNIFCNEIDTGFKPHQQLIKKMSFEFNQTTFIKHFVIKKEDRDLEVINFIENLGFSIFHSEIFFTPPNATRTIHIDGKGGKQPYNKIYKINWIYGGKDSEMIWFDVEPGYEPKKK